MLLYPIKVCQYVIVQLQQVFRKDVFPQRHTLRIWLRVIEEWGEEGVFVFG